MSRRLCAGGFWRCCGSGWLPFVRTCLRTVLQLDARERTAAVVLDHDNARDELARRAGTGDVARQRRRAVAAAGVRHGSAAVRRLLRLALSRRLEDQIAGMCALKKGRSFWPVRFRSAATQVFTAYGGGIRCSPGRVPGPHPVAAPPRGVAAKASPRSVGHHLIRLKPTQERPPPISATDRRRLMGLRTRFVLRARRLRVSDRQRRSRRPALPCANLRSRAEREGNMRQGKRFCQVVASAVLM
jgi:hypothetical protein